MFPLLLVEEGLIPAAKVLASVPSHLHGVQNLKFKKGMGTYIYIN